MVFVLWLWAFTKHKTREFVLWIHLCSCWARVLLLHCPVAHGCPRHLPGEGIFTVAARGCQDAQLLTWHLLYYQWVNRRVSKMRNHSLSPLRSSGCFKNKQHAHIILQFLKKNGDYTDLYFRPIYLNRVAKNFLSMTATSTAIWWLAAQGANSFCCGLVVTRDHNHADASYSAGLTTGQKGWLVDWSKQSQGRATLNIRWKWGSCQVQELAMHNTIFHEHESPKREKSWIRNTTVNSCQHMLAKWPRINPKQSQ